MKTLTIALLFALAISAGAQTQPDQTPAGAKPLPEVFALKIELQETQRTARQKSIGDAIASLQKALDAAIGQYVFTDIDQAEQNIAAEACRTVLNVEFKDCSISRNPSGGFMLSPKVQAAQTAKAPEPKPASVQHAPADKPKPAEK